MESSIEPKQQPHAVCIPFPIQGHINPMLKLAIILHHKGFHITFVNTDYNHNRLVRSQGPAAVQGLPDFQFATIPDGLSWDDDADSTQNISLLGPSTSKKSLGPLNDLIEKLNGSSLPPVSCVVADVLMTFALDAAEKIGVPGVLLRTAAACSFMCDKQMGRLVEEGLLPIKGESLSNGGSDTLIDWVPGMIPLRLTDFPDFPESMKNMIYFLISETSRGSQASAIIINTFDALEHDVINGLSTICPPIHAIGPLQLLFNQLVPKHNRLKWMSSSLWKEEVECLKWLDTKPHSSVIYVNFGSITMLTAQQLSEFAYGLAESKKNFLWIVRPDLVQGEEAALPPEYWEQVGNNGFVTGWCPQEQVLNHPAVGGFLNHCGWNSILESLSSGVPMLCWPFFADQHIDCKYLCEVWGVGIKLDNNVKRDEVGSLVRELLDGERGKVMKIKAMEWKEKAANAIDLGGSSCLSLDKLIREVLTS